MSAATPPVPFLWHDYSPALIRAIRISFGVLFRFPYKITYEGFDRLPAEGPAVLAPNHTCFLDPWFVSNGTTRRVYYLAWHGLFRSRLLGSFIERCGARPVNIDNPSDRTAWRASHSILGDGQLLCIFPEGFRGFDGHINPLQQGFIRIAQGSKAPIYPISMDGALSIWPRWRKLPRLGGAVHLRVLDPIQTIDPASGKKRDPATILREYREVMIAAKEQSLRSPSDRGALEAVPAAAGPRD